MPKALLLLAALAACFLAAPAPAKEPPASAVDSGALFQQLDANGDGMLASDEIPADKRSLFERLVRIGDGNADGKLSADEFAMGLSGASKPASAPATPKKPATATPGRPGKAERPGPGRLFARLDANQDGKVTLDEVPQARREMFSKMIARNDKDGDGALSLAEFSSGNPVRPASVAKPGSETRPQRDPAQIFKRLDRNGDGKLVADEAPEARREYVARIIKRGDTDGDGALTLEEFTAVARQAPNPTQPEPQAGKKKKKVAAQPASAKKSKKAAGKPVGLFGTIDANRDGQLDSSEIGNAPTAILKLDKDGDGSVSVLEAAAPMKKKKKNP